MSDNTKTPAEQAAEVLARLEIPTGMRDDMRQQIAERVHVNMGLIEAGDYPTADVFVEIGPVCLVLTPNQASGYLRFDHETHDFDGQPFDHNELTEAIDAMPGLNDAATARDRLALIRATAQVVYSYLASRRSD